MVLDCVAGVCASMAGYGNYARGRVIAIESMHTRGGAEEAAALATLLQPHQSLDLRRVVAQTIERMPCFKECVTTILHYLERIFLGQPNEDLRECLLQDIWKRFPRPSYEREQQEIYQLLESSLSRHRGVSLGVLIEVYGLGSELPAPFALDLAARIHLVEACPFLIRARRVGETIHVPLDKDLGRTIESLGCREQ